MTAPLTVYRDLLFPGLRGREAEGSFSGEIVVENGGLTVKFTDDFNEEIFVSYRINQEDIESGAYKAEFHSWNNKAIADLNRKRTGV